MPQNKSGKVSSQSPYVQTSILSDNAVYSLAERLYDERPPLRPLSSLLPRIPFYFSAIYEEESLYDWLSSKLDPVSENGDFLFDFAKYLDWWEKTGVYEESPQGRERSKKNKDLRLLIRRFGLGDDSVSPLPDQFLAIQAKGTLIWTDTHQWLILLRFFDILVYLRGVDNSSAERVVPSPRRLIALTGSLTQSWLGMRVDWQAALKESVAAVQAASGASDWGPVSNTSQSARAIAGPPDAAAASGSGDANEPGVSGSGELLPPAPVVAASFSSSLDVLFAKFDQMSLNAVFERILPSVKTADEQGQYLAICVNIQLAALVVNFIQGHAVEGGKPFRFSEITSHMPESLKASWKTARYIYQPFMLMISYTPLFLLARTRLYSSPLPSFSVAFEILKAMGNVGKPAPLQTLEKSLWSIVLQVAQGQSVHDILPVFASAWLSDIDNEAVTECKSWLDDFGLKAGAEKSGPIQDWDDEDEVKVTHEYTAHRDELRDWKPGFHENGKRRRSSPGPAPPPKKPARERTRPPPSGKAPPKALHKKAPRTPVPGKQRRRRSPVRSPSRASSEAQEAGSDEEDARGSGDERPDDVEDVAMLTGRLSPMSDIRDDDVEEQDEEEGTGGPTEGGEMDIDYGQPLPDAAPSFVPLRRSRNARAPSRARTGESEIAEGSQPGSGSGIFDEGAYEPVPVTIPVWSANGLQTMSWSPLRKKTYDLFESLSSNVVQDYAPGSAQSSVRVFSHAEFQSLSTREVTEIFGKQSILIRGSSVDPFWAWGLESLSVLRPVHGTVVSVQDPVESYMGQNGFDTVPVSIPDLVRVGREGGKVWNCLDLALGERRLVDIPHISGYRTFNILPFLSNVASLDPDGCKVDDVRPKMHWALAGAKGADTLQHVDTGGFATVVHVLSGQKLWAVGSRSSGAPFANESHVLKKADHLDDWQSVGAKGVVWECMLLNAGDTFLMRPSPHIVHTSENSICYGEYFLATSSLVDHVTSYAMTRIGDLVATNDRINSAPIIHSLASWWWDGDIAAGEDNYDPSARASRPSLEKDPRCYIALIAFNIFQTALGAGSYDEHVISELGIELDSVPDRLYWDATQSLHQWVVRQGIVSRKGEVVSDDISDAARIALLRDIVLDVGRGLYVMAVQHNRTEPGFKMAAFRKRLTNDVLAAYNLPSKKWLDDVPFRPRDVVPDVVFRPSPRPMLKFVFHK